MSRSLPHLGAMLTGRGAPRRIIAPRSLVVALSAGLVITGAGLVVPAQQLPAAAAAPVTDKALATKLASVLKDSRVTKGRTSAVVFDAATGSELFQRSGSRATMPGLEHQDRHGGRGHAHPRSRTTASRPR